MIEAGRWNSDPTYYAPICMTSDKHVYVGDMEFMTEEDGDMYVSTGKITKFWIEVHDTSYVL